MNRPTSKLISLMFSAGLVASTVLLNSCSKDDEIESIRPGVEIPTQFSELTVEEHKTQLEDNGLQLVADMTELKNNDGIQTTIAFDYFLSNAELPSGRVASNKAVSTMSLLADFGRGKTKASDVLSSFRVNEDTVLSTPQEVFDAYKGTYEYNSSTSTWDFTEGGDKIVFKFPSTETGTTNNAEFAVYGFASQQVINQAAGYEGDVPTALKADLTVNGTKKIEYSFAASYKANGEPTSVVTSLTIGAFKFAIELKNTSTEVAAHYALTKNGTNLISYGAGATGNFNSDNINNSVNTSDVINSASAYFQIMNIKFAGEVNVTSLDAALNAAATIQQRADALNADVTLVAFYADSKKKIADTEFYVTTTTDSYTYCYYDTAWVQQCETYTSDPYDIVDVRLIFADASKADLETYTSVGFEELEAELEAFADQLNADLNQ